MKNTLSQSQNESETLSQLPENVHPKRDALLKAFQKIDLNFDNEIDQEELLNFLDSNMRNGKKFDRSIANKIFSALDTDKSGKITVKEFILNFIHMEEEIKAHFKQLQDKFFEEKEKNANIQRLLLENKNEKLNKEGIGNNAKITIDIYNIEFLRQTVDILKRISIKMTFQNETKETRMVSGEENKVIWKEKFELSEYLNKVYFFYI